MESRRTSKWTWSWTWTRTQPNSRQSGDLRYVPYPSNKHPQPLSPTAATEWHKPGCHYRRQRTRFICRRVGAAQEHLQQCATIKSQRWLGALEHFQQHLCSSFKKSHGIDIDPSKSPFHNAVHIFNSTATVHNRILPLPSNLAFHDLTQDKSAPPEAKALLGLGGKFILTPPITTGNISISLRRLLRDLCIKVIFSGQEQEYHDQEKKSRLYVRSNWDPNYGELPGWVTGRMERFADRITPYFKYKRASENLLPLQKRLLSSLKQHPKLLFPETDKGLGPCCVTYDQYIEDALIHLNNKEIYRRISHEEADLAVHKVKTNINSWLSRFHDIVGKNVSSYIRQHMRSTQHPLLDSSTSCTKFIRV